MRGVVEVACDLKVCSTEVRAPNLSSGKLPPRRDQCGILDFGGAAVERCFSFFAHSIGGASFVLLQRNGHWNEEKIRAKQCNF